uniref:Uncharacterized protein n=1 Tax=Nelumbo nucifera TaxID=4432 RepID=A0A822YIQ6_NELNU|nr:TPA_asm: hypothetical protein HUJ06_010854 [Nelumbo nucifera]
MGSECLQVSERDIMSRINLFNALAVEIARRFHRILECQGLMKISLDREEFCSLTEYRC